MPLTFDGVDCHVPPEAIASAYPALIFSWGELETLGREPRLQRVVVDRLSERLPELSERLATSHAELASNREACEAARSELERIGMEDGGLLHRYRELKAKFERMNKPEVAELYKSLDEARSRVRALEVLDGRLQDFLGSLGQIAPAAPAGAVAGLSAETLAWWEEEVQEEVDLKGLESDLTAALALGAGCGEEDATGGGKGSPDQYEQAREIGYQQCADPLVDPDRAEEDPTGYAAERFGGSGEFDAAREAGCLEALGE